MAEEPVTKAVQLVAEEPVTQAVASLIEDIKAPNILVIGQTGAGKSSLINAVFGTDLATVGAGLPVTQHFHFYSNGLVNIYDSAGHQLSQGNTFIDNILQFLHTKQMLGIEEQIHLVWYVINAASARIECFEIDVINQLHQRGIPLIIVISQCDRASSKEIESVKSILADFEMKQAYDVIEVAAFPLVFRGKPISEPFGLEELVAKSIAQLPEIYADAVRMAQIVNLKSKRELAWKLIAVAAATTFSSAWIPIPGATTGSNLAIQSSLGIAIASVYGFGSARAFLPRIYKGRGTNSHSALSLLATTLGLDILRSIVPVAGNLLAGGTSASLIVITGLAYASAFEAIAKAHIDPNDSEAINHFLTASFPEEFKKYSDIVIKTSQDIMKIKDKFLES